MGKEGLIPTMASHPNCQWLPKLGGPRTGERSVQPSGLSVAEPGWEVRTGAAQIRPSLLPFTGVMNSYSDIPLGISSLDLVLGFSELFCS